MERRIFSTAIITVLISVSVNQAIFAREASSGYSPIDVSFDNSVVKMPVEDHDRIAPPILDQFQEGHDMKILVSITIPKWQEFIPTLDNLTSVEIYIEKDGIPNDLFVQIRDKTGVTVLEQKTFPRESVPAIGWFSVEFSQALTPGEIYRIYVHTNTPSGSTEYYYWWGNSDSTYCPRCDNERNQFIPTFDFAFRTYGNGVRRITNADFNGDRSTDISIYRPSNGKWYIKGESPAAWGLPGDLPSPGDYDGDGLVDIAVFRPSNGKWYVKGQGITSWGFTDDIPVPADYNGDGADDIAVLRPSTGRWYIQGMGNFSWYQSGDIPVPCDYDGDGNDEIAVFRPSNNNWYLNGSSPVSWALSGDIPVPADYDGDGSCDIAVYRPSNGNWYVSGQGMTSWGFSGDIPVPGDYDGCGDTEIAVLRPSNGRWYIQGMGNYSWYHPGDYPLPVRDTNADGDPYQ